MGNKIKMKNNKMKNLNPPFVGELKHMADKKNKNRIGLALTQISVLILSIIAVGYIIGDIGLVGAQEEEECVKSTTTGTVYKVSDVSEMDDATFNKWCDKNGGIAVCEGTSGDYTVIKESAIFECSKDKESSSFNLFNTAAGVDALTRALDKVIPLPTTNIPDVKIAGGAADVEKGSPGLVEGLLLKAEINPWVASGVASIVNAAAYAAATYIGVKWIAEKFGAKPGQAKALAAGAAAGIATGTILTSKLGEAILAALGVPGIGWIVAGVVAIIVGVLTWKDEKQKTVLFMCNLWQPQPGGNYCDKCNNGPFPCSEYQCSSLGVSCQIVNKGTKDQKCIWINRNDVDPPIMTPWQEALKEGYSYVDNKVVSPPDRGVFVKYVGSNNGCIPPYTSFSFGIKVNKESKCKADIVRESNFSNMRIPLSGESYLEEHKITLAYQHMKDLEAENIINISDNEKDHKLYVKCMSGNGIVTNAHLEFSYCIDDTPDLNPPQVIETSIINGAFVRFGVGSLNNFVLSIDKPGQCKWSTLDKTYGDMENTMTCSTNVRQSNAKNLYDCKTDLTGIKDREENNFYFRCEGAYNKKVSRESYKFTVFGTRPLVIDKMGPNGTIKDSTDPVKVNLTATTSAGAEKGKAICQYSATGKEGDYIAFYNTNSYSHSQELRRSGGHYTYYIKCFDLGGNTDIKTTNFTIEIDKSPPAVVRAFHEGNYLKIITNEEAECVYDTAECLYEFDDGIEMTTIDDKEHYTDWNTLLTFRIKCKDKYGNQPAPDQCSIIARPFIL